MALFKAGPLASEIRGSIGGTVFSRGRFGPVMRQRAKPVDPASVDQQNARAYLTAAQVNWRTVLSQAERDGWEAAAKATAWTNALGDSITLTGPNLYIRTATLYQLAGMGLPTNPPPSPATCPNPTLELSLSAVGKNFILENDNLELNSTHRYFIALSGNQARTVNFYKGPYDPVIQVQSTDTFPITLRANANLLADSRIFYTLRTLGTDGTVSPLFRGHFDVGNITP